VSFRAISTPARVLLTERPGEGGPNGAARRGPSCLRSRISTRATDHSVAFERMGEALRVPCSTPLNPVWLAGALGSRVRTEPFGVFVPASVVAGEMTGGARLTDKSARYRRRRSGFLSRRRSGSITRVALAAMFEPSGKT
jgi:hypothetical protein